MWNLERALGEIAGLPHVSLQPSAGSHGELAGVLLTKAYHADRGEHAHEGAHARHRARHEPGDGDDGRATRSSRSATNPDGGVDLDDLRAKADDDVACLMLTNPNTLGIFDPNIEEIAAIVHDVGATLYYDGANLNAVMGVSRPGDMGFDIVHFNLHKSFTQPHGGGGPGSGPIAVSDRIEPYLMNPRIVRSDGGRSTCATPARSRSGACAASRATTAASCAPTPTSARSAPRACKDASETAVLNANYLLARLRAAGVAEHLPLAFGELCMHEFVLSGAPMKRELGSRRSTSPSACSTTASTRRRSTSRCSSTRRCWSSRPRPRPRETLDAFADAIADDPREAADDPEIARNAPYTTPVRRLDEAAAAKRPVIRQAL